MIRETAESQEASGISVSFQEEFRCLHLAEQMRKKPCLAAKTTGTSSRQTFRYATHSSVVSFASPHAQQHSPVHQSRCLGHRHHNVLGQVGSRLTGSTPSTACGQCPLCPFPSMWPTLATEGSNSRWWGSLVLQGFVVGCMLQAFFLLLRQLLFLCLSDLSALVIPEKVLLALGRAAPCRMAMAKPLPTGLESLHKTFTHHVYDGERLKQMFCHFEMLIVHLPLHIWFSWSWLLKSNKFAVMWKE